MENKYKRKIKKLITLHIKHLYENEDRYHIRINCNFCNPKITITNLTATEKRKLKEWIEQEGWNISEKDYIDGNLEIDLYSASMLIDEKIIKNRKDIALLRKIRYEAEDIYNMQLMEESIKEEKEKIKNEIKDLLNNIEF